MRPNEKYGLERQTERKHWLLRFKSGCKAIYTNKRKGIIVVAYLILALFLWLFRNRIFHLQGADLFSVMSKEAFRLIFPVYAIGGLFFLVAALGTPFRAKAIRDNLFRIGLCNHAGEPPLLLAKYKDRKNPRVTVLEFEANGIPKTEWENKQDEIESALNVHVVRVAEGVSKRRILLYTVSALSALPKKLYWKDGYLSRESFVLVLGESLTGRKTVNLAQIPHILLGGSTGSGKSILLKLLVMQCVKKGAVVYIADFKGGVDFPAIWHRTCHIVTDEKDLLDTLTRIVDELERRKQAFCSAECANIDTYNRRTGKGLPHLIFACDEVAEVLDKTGLTKESKELVAKIESKLSVIARQGRAFGIHLILATQRPDATILSGQIRNNLDCRICGRADNVLSQIILDNTNAADQIPKDAQGRFLMYDGTVFQGYLFDERELS